MCVCECVLCVISLLQLYVLLDTRSFEEDVFCSIAFQYVALLFVGGLLSYLRYLCLLAYCDVQHILCCVFVLFFFVLCTASYVASFSRLPISDCPFSIPSSLFVPTLMDRFDHDAICLLCWLIYLMLMCCGYLNIFWIAILVECRQPLSVMQNAFACPRECEHWVLVVVYLSVRYPQELSNMTPGSR